jgi:hypothetical protein
LVVQLAGNASALVFLRVKQFSAQSLPGKFSLLAFGYLAPKLFIGLCQFRSARLNESLKLLGAISQLLVRLSQLMFIAPLLFEKVAHLILS